MFSNISGYLPELWEIVNIVTRRSHNQPDFDTRHHFHVCSETITVYVEFMRGTCSCTKTPAHVRHWIRTIALDPPRRMFDVPPSNTITCQVPSRLRTAGHRNVQCVQRCSWFAVQHHIERALSNAAFIFEDRLIYIQWVSCKDIVNRVACTPWIYVTSVSEHCNEVSPFLSNTVGVISRSISRIGPIRNICNFADADINCMSWCDTMLNVEEGGS